MFGYLLVGILSAAIALGRLFTTNPDSVTEIVWAEDGLFPLCIANHGYWNCLWEPYAGYLPFLSRTLAVPIAFVPLEHWPMATNVLAAIAYGLFSVLVYWLLRKIDLNQVLAIFGALVPVLLPLVGLEAVNVVGSLYMVLLVAATIAASIDFERVLPSWTLPLLLLVSALTIPIALLLALPIIFRTFIGSITLRKAALPLSALFIGSSIQFMVIFRATDQRPIDPSVGSFAGWLEGLSASMASLVGFRVELLDTGQVTWTGYPLGQVLGAVLLAVSVVLISLGLARSKDQAAALMFLTGILMSAVPSILGFDNNRYFVVLTSLTVIAILVFVGQYQQRTQTIVSLTIVIGLLVLWVPAFGASSYRATPSPKWSDMITDARFRCAQYSESPTTILTFTPQWPFPDFPRSEFTNADIACAN